MTLEDRAAIFENFSNFFKKYYLLTKKIHFFYVDESVFHFYERANQTRLPVKLKEKKIKNGDPFNMAAYGRKAVCRFLCKGPQLLDMMSKDFEKNHRGRKPRWLPRDFFSTGCDNYNGPCARNG